jgi:protein involved in polysaccharide export with SLBB domain
LKKAGGLKLESNAEIAYLVRTLSNKTKVYYHLNLKDILANPASVQNMALEALDEVTIYSTKDFIDFFSISVSGAVRKPGNFEFVAGITLRDAIMNAGGLKKESIVEQAYLIRTKADLTKEYIRISLVDIMDSASKNNRLLEPLDAVVVYNKADYVDLLSNDNNLRNRIKKLVKMKNFFPACDFCDGRPHAPENAKEYAGKGLIKAGKQTSSRIPFEAYK